MEAVQYAKDITAEDLRLLLEFWPKFMAEADEAQQMLVEIKDQLLNGDAESFSWCHLKPQHRFTNIDDVTQNHAHTRALRTIV